MQKGKPYQPGTFFLASVDFISYNSSSFFIKFISNHGKLYFWICCEQKQYSGNFQWNFQWTAVQFFWLNTPLRGQGWGIHPIFLGLTRGNSLTQLREIIQEVKFGRNFSPFCPNKTFFDYRTLCVQGGVEGVKKHNFCIRMAPREFRWWR